MCHWLVLFPELDSYEWRTACRHVEAASELTKGRPNTSAIALDVKDSAALLQAVSSHDVVIRCVARIQQWWSIVNNVLGSLIPYTFHALVIDAAVKAKKHFVSTSYVYVRVNDCNSKHPLSLILIRSPAMLAFDQAAKDAGITVLNEIGVDPGIDHLYAIRTIHQVHAAGGKV